MCSKMSMWTQPQHISPLIRTPLLLSRLRTSGTPISNWFRHWKPQGKVKAESKCLLEEPPDGGTVNSVKCLPTDGWCWESRRCSRTSDPSDALDGGRKSMLKCTQRGEYVSHPRGRGR